MRPSGPYAIAVGCESPRAKVVTWKPAGTWTSWRAADVPCSETAAAATTPMNSALLRTAILRRGAAFDQEIVDLLQVLERGVEILALEPRLLRGPRDVACRLEASDDVGVLALRVDRVVDVEPALAQHLPDQAHELRQGLVGRVGCLLLEIGPARLPLMDVEARITHGPTPAPRPWLRNRSPIRLASDG